MKTIWVFISLFRGPWDCEEELTIEPWRPLEWRGDAGCWWCGCRCAIIHALALALMIWEMSRDPTDQRELWKLLVVLNWWTLSNGSTDEHVIAPGMFLFFCDETLGWRFPLMNVFFPCICVANKMPPPFFLCVKKKLEYRIQLFGLLGSTKWKWPNFQVWSAINNMEPLMTWTRCGKETPGSND